MSAGRMFLPMLFQQLFGPRLLERRAELHEVTDASANVVQYNDVMSTQLAVAYAAGLAAIHRTRSQDGGEAFDLACGPGHFTLCLARYLGYSKVTGLDLSQRMVDLGAENAKCHNLVGQVEFERSDISNLGQIADGSLALSTFTDAAHHMPDLGNVQTVLAEMDRVTAGIVMVMDLARLRTAELTERYVNTLGHDYKARGLPAFFDDFRNSMYAAWTVDELHSAIPRRSQRYWCHIVPRGLPTIQIILGLPKGRKKVFVRGGEPWSPENCPVPQQYRSEWRILKWTLALGSRRIVPPGTV